MHPDIIPSFLIALLMFHLAFMGVRNHRAGIAFDPMYFLIFLPQAGMYLFFFIVDLPLEVRGFWVRVSAILIPACLDVVLVLQYRRQGKQND